MNFCNSRKMHPPSEKGVLGRGVEGVSLYVMHKKCALPKAEFLLSFQQSAAIAAKGSKLHKTENSPKTVGCCSRYKRGFLWFGCCVACCLNGWLCDISVLLCSLLALLVLSFCCCVLGTDANGPTCLFPVLLTCMVDIALLEGLGSGGTRPFFDFHFVFKCFCLGGSREVTWPKPKGPPHLTLNLACFFVCFLLLVSSFV